MKTSIIIPSFNNTKLIKNCLDSLAKNTDLADAEIIVVDNASDKETIAHLKNYPKIITVFNKKNLGFAKACNQGAEEAKGEILIFLNNDTEVKSNWLGPLLKDLAEPKVAAAAPKLLYPNGLIQFAGVTFAEDKIPRHIYRGRSDFAGTNKRREFQALTAACLAIKKELFEEAGRFDEKYINGLEDTDLCLKLIEKDYRLIYEPKSVVIHHESVSEGRLEHALVNTDRFMERWSDKIKPDEHRILREDSTSWLSIWYHDIIEMAYYKNRYGTTPKYVLYLRFIVTIPHKIYTFLRLLFTGDFKTINEKLGRGE